MVNDLGPKPGQKVDGPIEETVATAVDWLLEKAESPNEDVDWESPKKPAGESVSALSESKGVATRSGGAKEAGEDEDTEMEEGSDEEVISGTSMVLQAGDVIKFDDYVFGNQMTLAVIVGITPSLNLVLKEKPKEVLCNGGWIFLQACARGRETDTGPSAVSQEGPACGVQEQAHGHLQ